MNHKKLFVTVGTTNFHELIHEITSNECIHTLLDLGFTLVQLQTGRNFREVKLDDLTLPCEKNDTEHRIVINNKLTLLYNDYFEDFEQQIMESDLVISHAGAGTCLEVLKHHKPLVVVINESLMDNHQIELAEEMQNRGYLYYSTCSGLIEVLKKDFSLLKQYPEPDECKFSNYLDKSMGFS